MSIAATKARSSFPELVRRAKYGKKISVVNMHYKPYCAIVPIEMLRILAGEPHSEEVCETFRGKAQEALTGLDLKDYPVL